jgi:PTH1 family peptidyl-tRNA hydrolase
LNTPDFFRLRFGIGRPDNDNIGVADWVLSRFSTEQQELMQNVFSQTNLLLVKVLLSKEPKDLVQGWGKKKLI